MASRQQIGDDALSQETSRDQHGATSRTTQDDSNRDGCYRNLFKRQSSFEQVSRYINGLVLSDNKTFQGIHSPYASSETHSMVGRRAMHWGVFESPWQWNELMRRHRQVVSQHYLSKERNVIS